MVTGIPIALRTQISPSPLCQREINALLGDIPPLKKGDFDFHFSNALASVLTHKFLKLFVTFFPVIPAEAGIQSL